MAMVGWEHRRQVEASPLGTKGDGERGPAGCIYLVSGTVKSKVFSKGPPLRLNRMHFIDAEHA
jgi:hypothetical protein